jgi:hypothetical protein
MFSWGHRTLPIVEYTSASARANRARLRQTTNTHNPIEIKPIRLAVALAKTILTRDPSDLDLLYEVPLKSLDRVLPKVLYARFLI